LIPERSSKFDYTNMSLSRYGQRNVDHLMPKLAGHGARKAAKVAKIDLATAENRLMQHEIAALVKDNLEDNFGPNVRPANNPGVEGKLKIPHLRAINLQLPPRNKPGAKRHDVRAESRLYSKSCRMPKATQCFVGPFQQLFQSKLGC